MGNAKRGEKPQPPKKKLAKKAGAPASVKTPAPEILRPIEPKNSDQKPWSVKDGNRERAIKIGNNAKPHVPLLELSTDHLYFAKRFALNENACKAARESGFSEWYGSAILANEPLIVKEVTRIRAARSAKFEVNADRIILELTRVAFGNIDDFVKLQSDGTPLIDCHDIGRSEMAAVSEITQDTYTERSGPDPEDLVPVKKTKLKFHSKVQALDQLSRIFKLFGEDGGLDKDTPEEKAAKIRKALLEMAKIDGLPATATKEG